MRGTSYWWGAETGRRRSFDLAHVTNRGDGPPLEVVANHASAELSLVHERWPLALALAAAGAPSRRAAVSTVLPGKGLELP